MGLFLVSLFIIVPALEIAIFISVGGAIGLGFTLMIIVLTAFIGAVLIRKRGLKALFRAENYFENGQFPIVEVFEALWLVVSAILLITPGFLTDILGFLLFVSSVRVWLKKIITRTLIVRSDIHANMGGVKTEQTDVGQKIIDGEFEEIKPAENSNLSAKLKE